MGARSHDAAQQPVAGDGGRVGRSMAGAMGVRPPRLNRSVMRTMGKAYAIPISLVIIGVALALWANSMPRYHDAHWMDRFLSVQATLDNSQALSDEWYAAQE